jgi:glutamine synthetase type I
MMDGSSIAGWKAINESDMTLMPDLSTAVMDPFTAQPTLIISCDTLEPSTGQAYSRCPRSVAKRAEAHISGSGIGDTGYFGPEAEFFVFDDVRFKVSMNEVSYRVDSSEGPYNTDRKYEEGNMGHRPPVKGGYFPVPPVDSEQDLRGEMLTMMEEMGLDVEKHHHEVAPAQHELGFKYNTLVKCADQMQIYKYVVHMVAHNYGKTATFMPKPLVGDNGSGMHVHQSIWKGGKNLFAGNGYAGLSDFALYYIGGIIKHARALNAITNPTTNSYKRLVPGFEAPVKLAYSSRNRSASIRIPHVASDKARRIEARFPDPMANPYLAFSALMMAGLDGVENKIHPGEAATKDLYHLPPEEDALVPTVCHSLDQALEYLDKDRAFLTKGGVFTDSMIDAYIELKMVEVTRFRQAVHPIEYEMYYSL